VTTATTPRVNLRVPAGARFEHEFPAPLGDNGQPLTVSGWTGRGEIKARPESTTAYYTWPASLIVCAGTTVTVTIPGATSRLWAWPAGVDQIELDNPAEPGEPYRLASGVVVVGSPFSTATLPRVHSASR
jgi:hypothetical protein